MTRVPIAALAALLGVTACASSRTSGVRDVTPVQVWTTTGDRAMLLARRPDAAPATPAAGSTDLITVDASRRFQSMVGFGAALTDASAYVLMHDLAAAARDSLLRELFDPAHGVGFGFLRLDMGASDFALHDYSYDDPPGGMPDTALAYFSIAPDTAETIPILRRALALNPALAIMASPWSAPAWMKTSGSMIKGTLRPEYYDAYAEYFARFLEAYAAAGIPVFAITVQNEPHFEPDDYPGMRMEPPARAAFVGAHLGPLLKRRGLSARILDWDHNWDQPESPLAVLGDSLARRYVSGVAWHCYAGDVGAQGPVHDAYPDKDAYFTECSGGDWAPRFAENLVWMGQVLLVGSVRNWSRGVLMWNLALDETHGPHTGGCGDCRGVVTVNRATGAVTRNEEYYALAQASAFVRAGARRVASDGGPAGVAHVAFVNPDSSRVLIAVNDSTRTAAVTVRDGARAFRDTLPAASITTFRWSPR